MKHVIAAAALSLAIFGAADAVACPWVPGHYGPAGRWWPGHCVGPGIVGSGVVLVPPYAGWEWHPGWGWHAPGGHWYWRHEYGWRHY